MTTLVENLKAPKNARLELKTTEFAKDFIKTAAAASGLDMTAFIIASAFEKAEAVMEKQSRLQLSSKAYDRLNEILNETEDNVRPTPELIKLMRGKNGRRTPRL